MFHPLLYYLADCSWNWTAGQYLRPFVHFFGRDLFPMISSCVRWVFRVPHFLLGAGGGGSVSPSPAICQISVATRLQNLEHIPQFYLDIIGGVKRQGQTSYFWRLVFVSFTGQKSHIIWKRSWRNCTLFSAILLSALLRGFYPEHWWRHKTGQ